MFFIELFVFALLGAVAGFFGGLLGIGGGLITVPSLLLIFYLFGFPPYHSMQMAMGTSLGSMIFTAASSAFAHFLEKGVYWNLFFALTPGIVLGSLSGAFVADFLQSKELELVFGISVCLIGAYFIFGSQKTNFEGFNPSVHPLVLSFVGFALGAFSTILGIGGGIVTVPILIFFGTPLRNAISTSAVTGFLIALIGAFAFLFLGFHQKDYPDSIGYLYLPAFFVMGPISALLAPYGARLTYKLPASVLRKIFGLVLIGTGISMIIL